MKEYNFAQAVDLGRLAEILTSKSKDGWEAMGSVIIESVSLDDSRMMNHIYNDIDKKVDKLCIQQMYKEI